MTSGHDAAAAPAPTLVVIDPNGRRARVPLYPFPFRMGRGPDNNLILRDSRVSRNHAQIAQVDGSFVLEDLASRHGVWVNGQRVEKSRVLEGLEQKVGVLAGEVPDEVVAAENGVRFVYDLAKGQKTGGFLDQRENHWAARRYSSGEVLDCFSYQGGFALTVAGAAQHVEAIDMAPAAVNAARRNQKLKRP